MNATPPSGVRADRTGPPPPPFDPELAAALGCNWPSRCGGCTAISTAARAGTSRHVTYGAPRA
ncbi:hypothetical protein [Streptomyces scopuliridis]|uniref:hypothetical protein n=1 Tax=Streptomyces scopuliridis TaxID=452529 RepID=UPI0036A8067A